jgi:hypothetical protein
MGKTKLGQHQKDSTAAFFDSNIRAAHRISWKNPFRHWAGIARARGLIACALPAGETLHARPGPEVEASIANQMIIL